MTNPDLAETLELMLVGSRLKRMILSQGTPVQEAYRTHRQSVQVWGLPNEQGYCAVYSALVLPKDLREIPEYLVGLPSSWIASEDLETMEPIADVSLPEWARFIVCVNYLMDMEPFSTANSEE